MTHTNTKSVRFNDKVVTIKSLHINNYTDEEVFSSWFTKNEYKQIKREIKLTVSMMDKQSKFAEGINFSSRGLENRTQDQLVEKAQNHYCAIDAVLDEQDRQNKWGIRDPIALRCAYVEYSFVSHMEAFLLAAKDEKVAFEGHLDNQQQPRVQKLAAHSRSSGNKGNRGKSLFSSTKVVSEMNVILLSHLKRISIAA